MDFIKQIKEVCVSVLPIALIAIVLGMVFSVFHTSDVSLIQFILSVFGVIIGLSLFLLGINLGFVPVGNHLGSAITGKKNVILILIVGLALGIIITIAEPDVEVLTEQVHQINPALSKSLLVAAIALGVGVFVALSFLRTITGFSMKLSFAIGIILLFAVAFFVPEFFRAVAFDSGGATTGPMAVPFIMALGMGVTSAMGHNEEDSFGYAGLASIGPVLFVLLLGALSKGEINAVVAESSSVSLFALFMQMVREVALALLPLVVISVVVQMFSMKLPPLRAIRMYVGILYTFVGMTLFLFSVKSSFMPVASSLGVAIANIGNWALILTGIVLGATVVLAEPAICVLTEQVEEVSQRRIRRGVMLMFISVGVASAVALTMLRIMNGISIMVFLIAGYAAILALMPFTPTLFVGIAFDSGGVATGPMSSTFLLPFVIGAAGVVSGDVSSASFGMIGLIAMMPVLLIEILGVIFRFASRGKEV